MGTLASLLAIVCSASVVASCGRSEGKGPPGALANKKGASSEDAAPAHAELGPGRFVMACWEAYNAKDEGLLAKCYGDSSELSLVDFAPPMRAVGTSAALAFHKSFWDSSSDLKSEAQLVLRSGQRVAAILLTSGTNDGPFLDEPPSEQSFSRLEAQLLSVDPQGTIAKTEIWLDQNTVAHQAALPAMAGAPDQESAWPEEIFQVAENSPAESANLKLVQSLRKSMQDGNTAPFMAHVAEDVSFRYQGQRELAVGREAYAKVLTSWMGMNQRVRLERDLWAAGKWVVSVNDNITPAEAGPPEGKGQSVKSRTLEFFRFVDGKLSSHWVFENSQVYSRPH